jgi:hypothetical protein
LKGKNIFFSYSGFFNYLKIIPFVAILALIPACGKKISAGKFNSKAWQSDRLGCNNQRKTLLPELEELKPKLIGINQSELDKILGKPDANGLADQGEHLYYYYLEAGAQCQYPAMLSSANKLIVRINALNLVTETRYEQPLKK